MGPQAKEWCAFLSSFLHTNATRLFNCKLVFHAVYLIKRATPYPMFDRSSRTALHWATIQGRLNIMQLLLESRVFYQEFEGERLIDKQDLEGWTPLAIALHYK